MKILFIIISLALVGCYSGWKDPETSLPAKKVSIRSLLSTPAVYDNRGVIVEGKVWDLEYLNLDYTVAKFKLADKSGNHIGVISKEVLKIGNGDIIEVRGIFERNFDSEKNRYESFVNSMSINVKSDS